MTLNRVRAGRANASWPCECGCAGRTPRYPTDLTDEQRAVLEPLLPVMPCLTPLGGRPEKHWRRTMIDAMFYLAGNGIKWRALPAGFPPWRTVYGLHARWKEDGVLADITGLLRAAVRTAAGRHPEPSAAVMDSQSVHESAEGVVPAATSGYDAYKKISGRKRHLLVDTLGLLVTAAVTSASAAGCQAAPLLLARARRRGRRRLALAWADSGYYGGGYQDWARTELGITVQVVEPPRLGRGHGFQVLPRRWVVERTNAWISRRRRCARDYERLPAHHAAMIYWAAILQLTRRLATTTTTA